jgi:hypothetical protein
MQPFEGYPVDSILETRAKSDLDVSKDLASKSTASINDLLNGEKDNQDEKHNEEITENSQEDTEESKQESHPTNQG